MPGDEVLVDHDPVLGGFVSMRGSFGMSGRRVAAGFLGYFGSQRTVPRLRPPLRDDPDILPAKMAASKGTNDRAPAAHGGPPP